MTYANNKVAQILGTTYPLIQAPMSWITNARLVAAVSNAGGLGVLGPNAGGLSSPNAADLPHQPRTVAEKVATYREEIRKTKEQTDKPFAINIIMPGAEEEIDEYNQGLLEAAFAEGVKHFVTVSLDLPNKKVFAYILKHGGVIIHRPITPTIANMRAAQELGAHLLVATGYDEGGYTPERQLGTFTVVPTMVDAVDIPVLAAGGINDRRGVNAAFALGAQGVFIGTRFIVTKESPAAESTKSKILQSGVDNIIRVSHFQRSIVTPKAQEYAAYYAANPEDDLDSKIQQAGGLRPGMLVGDHEQGIISVNMGIDVIRTIPSVVNLIKSLME